MPHENITTAAPLRESIRRCPTCDEQFHIDLDKGGRPPIFCSAECKRAAKASSLRLRYCPTCDTKFSLQPHQAAATSYCSEQCKDIASANIRAARENLCILPGCRNPKVPGTGYSKPQFCSEACAVQDHAQRTAENPDLLQCRNCQAPLKHDPTTLRRCPKFCGQDCREEWYKQNVDQIRYRAANNQRGKTTRQLTKRNRSKPKCPPAPSLHHRTAPDRPSVLIWSEMPPHIRQQWESLGWTEEDWITEPSVYSPAAWRKATGTSLPTDPPLPAVEIQHNLLDDIRGDDDDQ